MKTVILLLSIVSTLILQAEEVYFSCNFNSMNAEARGEKLPPKYFSANRTYQTKTGGGVSSRAAIFARENLDDFKVLREGLKDLTAPLPAIVYTPLKAFPSPKGYIDFWIAPYFNQITPYRDNKKCGYSCNYILHAYKHKTDGHLIDREGKGEMRIFIYNRTLLVEISFADGSQSQMTYNIAKWNAKQYQRITVCWNKNEQQLYINRKLVVHKKVKGIIPCFDTIEIGGRDKNLSFQGLIDDIKIAKGFPKSLSVHFDGDNKKFLPIKPNEKVIAVKQWPDTKNIRVESSGNGVVFNPDIFCVRPLTQKISGLNHLAMALFSTTLVRPWTIQYCGAKQHSRYREANI